MTVKKADIEVTHGLLVFHTNSIGDQLKKDQPDLNSIISSLRKIEGECETSIQLAQKLKGAQ